MPGPTRGRARVPRRASSAARRTNDEPAGIRIDGRRALVPVADGYGVAERERVDNRPDIEVDSYPGAAPPPGKAIREPFRRRRTPSAARRHREDRETQRRYRGHGLHADHGDDLPVVRIDLDREADRNLIVSPERRMGGNDLEAVPLAREDRAIGLHVEGGLPLALSCSPAFVPPAKAGGSHGRRVVPRRSAPTEGDRFGPESVIGLDRNQ